MATAPSPSSSAGLVTGLKIVSLVIAVGVVIQAWLGSSGLFQGESGRIDLHGYIANAFFLLVVVQGALALFAMQRGLVSRNVLIATGVNILITFAQIGLGYSTRDGENFSNAISMHIPVGVALMGTSALIVAMVWNASGESRRS